MPEAILKISDEQLQRAVRAVLDDLVSSGRILPPGGERREDWGVHYPDGEVIEGIAEDHARQILATATEPAALVRRDRIVWADGADYRGPWTVAE